MREREGRNRLLEILNESDDIKLAAADEYNGKPAIVVTLAIDFYGDAPETAEFILVVIKPDDQR